MIRKHTYTKYTAADKLDDLVTKTEERRYLCGAYPRNHVMSELELGDALRAWKECYWTWMHPESVTAAYGLTQNQWQQLLRRNFRSYLFHLCGCYELTLFFLVAPFTLQNLELFRQCFEPKLQRGEALNEALNEAKMHVRGEV